ncbi:11289_t:CDS:2, partial [Dentiscutata erythropus]
SRDYTSDMEDEAIESVNDTEASTSKRKCGTCRLGDHNARTWPGQVNIECDI